MTRFVILDARSVQICPTRFEFMCTAILHAIFCEFAPGWAVAAVRVDADVAA